MFDLKWIIRLFSLLLISSTLLNGCAKEEWIDLFDGKTIKGWKSSGNGSLWGIESGMLVSNSGSSNLFYDGDVSKQNFKNFELLVDVKVDDVSNSGIFFHTKYQEAGLPKKGYQCQILNSSSKTVSSKNSSQNKTGSLSGIRNLFKSPVKDGEWFNYHIIVQGKTIQTYINGELMVDYTEPENPYRTDKNKGSILASGTFALQGNNSKGKVYFKNIKVKPLPNGATTIGNPIDDLEFESKLIDLSSKDFPLMDLHAHLKGGLTTDQVLENARKYGFTYGIAFNCGLQMTFETEDALQEFLSTYNKPPHTYLAIQAEGREWVDIFSKETVDQFDYVFTDAMTWTNDNGKRMRLWLKEETEVGDPDNFMDQLVNRIESIIGNEPVDIYVNATYLPDEIVDRYDNLWTEDRMDKVIKVLVDNNVAMEISARYKIPSATFIKRAKDAGVKFTFGTNNIGADDLGRLDYCIEMVEVCNLTSNDLWGPE